MICKNDSVMQSVCVENGLPVKCLPLVGEFDLYSGYMVARAVKSPLPPFKKGGDKVGFKKVGSMILHLHTAHAVSIGLIAKFFHRNIRLIAIRRVDFSIKRRSLIKYNHKFLDSVVCISKNIYNVVLKNGVIPNKLRIIHSGVDTNRFTTNTEGNDFRHDILTKYSIPKDHTIIGTIAALVDHKDYPTLLKAAKIVIKTLDNVTFVAIGEGDKKESILKIHDDLKLGDGFIFLGFEKDIKKYLHGIDIFVLASKEEGLGTSILDAMSAQKPIVACNGGGIPEMVKHDINGLLAEKENPEDLAEKLIKMINDMHLRERLSKQAVIDVQEFDIKNTVKKYLQIYSDKSWR